jgi:hypothetical protein
MQLSLSQELVANLTVFDIAGGMNLFDVKPSWKDSKFILYPIRLQQIDKYEVTLEVQKVNYRFMNQQDYKRIKGIFRLMYLTEKVLKGKV